MPLGELRIRLDKMGEKIVSGLKGRSCCPQNPTIYRVNGMNIISGLSYADIFLKGNDIEPCSELVRFYKGILSGLCPPGDDPETYGASALADLLVLRPMNERIQAGTDVAESKIAADHSILDIAHDASLLAAKLKDPAREQEVMDNARGIAMRYGLDTGIAENVFKWIVYQTLQREVAYVQRRETHKNSI